MTASGSVREFFEKVLQQVYKFKDDVIVGDTNAVTHKLCTTQEYQDLHNS